MKIRLSDAPIPSFKPALLCAVLCCAFGAWAQDDPYGEKAYESADAAAKAPSVADKPSAGLEGRKGSITTRWKGIGPEVDVKPVVIPGYVTQGATDIVREGQTGPITRQRDMTLRMARDLVNQMSEERKKAIREGRMGPDVGKHIPTQADIWAARKKAIEEREAQYGPETTKEFVVPGTTPEVSARIHSEKAGYAIVDGVPSYVDENGELLHKLPVDPIPGAKENSGVMRIVESSEQYFEIPQTERPSGPLMPAQSGLSGETSDPSFGFDMDLTRKIEGTPVIQKDFPAGDKSSCDGCTLPGKPVSKLKKRRFRDILQKFLPVESASAAEISAADVADIVKQGQAIKEKVEQGKIDIGIDFKSVAGDEILKEAHSIVSDLKKSEVLDKAMKEKFGSNPMNEEPALEPDAQFDTFIFVSYSLGDKALSDILKYASEHQNVEVVMRGVPEKSNIWQGVQRLQALGAKFDPIPNAILDPGLFRAYGVTSVPTVVRVDPKERMSRPPVALIGQAGGGEQPPSSKRTISRMIAKVSGLNNAHWLNEQIKFGKSGDLGNQGYTLPIDERDIIEVMQERMLAIDWDAKRKRAYENFWNGQQKLFVRLPACSVTRTRTVDPSIMLTDDFTDSEGNIIHKKGTVLNPLDMTPFDRALVVFNPTSEPELEAAKIEGERLMRTPGIHKVIYLVTAMRGEKGWDFYKEVTDKLDAPIFYLTPEIQARWELTVTPSIITADMTKKLFVVNEIVAQTETAGDPQPVKDAEAEKKVPEKVKEENHAAHP